MTKPVSPDESPEDRAARLARLRESRRKYAANNREKLREIDARYRANPEIAEKKREHAREWRLNNPDAARENSARWRAEHPDEVRANTRAYTESGASSLKLAKRRAQKRANGWESFTLQDLIERWGTDCHLCGLPVDMTAPRLPGVEGWQMGFHIEHVVPLSAGGAHTLDNVRPSHGVCNLRKGAKNT